MLRALARGEHAAGPLSLRVLYGCTVGVFWEFGELFSDVILRTHIQHSLHETMRDLIADAFGATASVALLFVGSRLSSGSRVERVKCIE
jgi:hypothetical protein